MAGGVKRPNIGGERKGDPERAERLRQALRENLKRRKSQARGRTRGSGGSSHDSAGFVPDKSDR